MKNIFLKSLLIFGMLVPTSVSAATVGTLTNVNDTVRLNPITNQTNFTLSESQNSSYTITVKQCVITSNSSPSNNLPSLNKDVCTIIPTYNISQNELNFSIYNIGDFYIKNVFGDDISDIYYLFQLNSNTNNATITISQ